MNNIVIVEDNLHRGISLAEQFMELSESYPEWDINVLAVCYFQKSREKAEQEIEAYGQQPFTVKWISLWNFAEVMDEYTNPQKQHAMAIIDFFLYGDSSDGVPMRRVNIRYARSVDEERKKCLWFYTATGAENQEILCKLVGKEHVLDVIEVGDTVLRLNLEKEELLNALQRERLAVV